MRITNKIMQLNSLNNINLNKVNEDTLNNQMASGKKVLRPSDDPVLAIRSLRLRSTLTDVTQYLEKNAEDADSWLKVTEDSITTVNDCLEDAISQCNKGAVDHLTTGNRNIILDALRSLKDEIYASGDADYAGRGVFTGYRTSTKLLFQVPETVRYDINEPKTKFSVEEFTYVKLNSGEADGGINNPSVGEVNSGNFDTIDYPKDTDIYDKKLSRIRLSYEELDNPISYKESGEAFGIFEEDADNKVDFSKLPSITYTMLGGMEFQIPVTVISKYDKTKDPYLAVENALNNPIPTPPPSGSGVDDNYCYRDVYGKAISAVDYYGDGTNPGEKDIPYHKDTKGRIITKKEYDDLEAEAAGNAERLEELKEEYTTVYAPQVSDDHVDANGNKIEPKAVFIPETGELILNDAAKEILSSLTDYDHTKDVDEGQINISYTKTNFNKGDLRPEHYFEATQYVGGNKTILHNKGGIQDEAENQIISYDVGFNQTIRVNTIAPDIYDPGIVRDIDDLIDIIEQVSAVESTITSLEEAKEKLDPSDEERMKKVEEALATAKKAYTYLEDKMQKMFENGITRFKDHQAKATLALTEVGTRTSKLKLVQSRLGSQQTNFKELVANNDQVDIAEVATMLKSAQLAYDASLQATAKINQTTLLNYL